MNSYKPLLILFSAFFFSFFAIAQKSDEPLQQEINQEVWIPFIDSYNQMDAERFNSLHSDEVLRAGSWSIRRGEEYKEGNRKSFEKGIQLKRKRSIELRFDMRKTEADISYQTGFYKVVSQEAGQEPKTYYGYFHVVIQKINGRWLITQDWDDDQINGNAVGEADFLKAKALSSGSN